MLMSSWRAQEPLRSSREQMKLLLVLGDSHYTLFCSTSQFWCIGRSPEEFKTRERLEGCWQTVTVCDNADQNNTHQTGFGYSEYNQLTKKCKRTLNATLFKMSLPRKVQEAKLFCWYSTKTICKRNKNDPKI